MGLYYLYNVNTNKRFIVPEDYNISEYIRNNSGIFGISETDTKMLSDSNILNKTLKNGWVRIAYFQDRQTILIDHYGLPENKLKEVLNRTKGVAFRIMLNDVANRDRSYSIDKERPRVYPKQQEQQQLQFANIINKIKILCH